MLVLERLFDRSGLKGCLREKVVLVRSTACQYHHHALDDHVGSAVLEEMILGGRLLLLINLKEMTSSAALR